MHSVIFGKMCVLYTMKQRIYYGKLNHMYE